MKRLRIVADDLTGALDTAVGFAGANGPVPVLRKQSSLLNLRAAALDIATRELAADSLQPALETSERFLADASLSFKKIDSLLRGHWAAEVAALWASGSFARCVVAPAFPDQGRLTVQGCLTLREPSGHLRKADVEPIVESLTRAGLAGARSASTEDLANDTQGVAVVDIGSAQDLQGLAMAGQGWSGRTLWVGSAGLARALAGAPVPKRLQVSAPLLFVIGTAHPRTRAQLRRLRDMAPTGLISHTPGGDPIEAARRLCSAMHGSGRFAALTFDLPAQITAAQADREIHEALEQLLPQINPPPSTLFASGGQTLSLLCDSLDCSQLRAHAEWTPGVVHASMADGRWANVELISKSGAFGDDEVLVSLARSASFASEQSSNDDHGPDE